MGRGMYYARHKSSGENGYHHLRPIRTLTKQIFRILYFHFQTRSNYLKWSNQSFPVDPLHIDNESKLNIIYAMHSGDGIHSFQRKQCIFGDYLGVDLHNNRYSWRNLTLNVFVFQVHRV